MSIKLIHRVNILFTISIMALFSGLSLFITRPKTDRNILPETVAEIERAEKKETYREANPLLVKETELRNCWTNIDIVYTTTDITDYLGRHYITAYCPEECGFRVYEDGTDNFPNGWITSTGTIAHREAEWYEPSTCGIATDYHRYGELFYIEGKVYRAEDTGYISGAWIDLFMPSYEQMMQFGSHYTDVYAVEINEHELSAKERKEINELIGCYLHGRSFGSGVPYRSNSRTLY